MAKAKRKPAQGKPNWHKYKYFFWFWLAITSIVLIGYHTSFDRERICNYQYCPSSWVLAACTACIVMGIVWADFFFCALRPFLQLLTGKLVGARVQLESEEHDSSIWDLLAYQQHEEFWRAAPDASIIQRAFVVLLDLICLLLFLMIPMALIIGSASGLAYLEQQYSAPPAGLQSVQKADSDQNLSPARP